MSSRPNANRRPNSNNGYPSTSPARRPSAAGNMGNGRRGSMQQPSRGGAAVDVRGGCRPNGGRPNNNAMVPYNNRNMNGRRGGNGGGFRGANEGPSIIARCGATMDAIYDSAWFTLFFGSSKACRLVLEAERLNADQLEQKRAMAANSRNPNVRAMAEEPFAASIRERPMHFVAKCVNITATILIVLAIVCLGLFVGLVTPARVLVENAAAQCLSS